MVMFWVRAMFVASSASSRVVRMFSLSYIVMRSCVVDLASSGLSSLCTFVCFHMAFRLSAGAMSTV